MQYIVNSPPSASTEAFLQAIEVVTANLEWLKDNEEDIINAFGGIRTAGSSKKVHNKIKNNATTSELAITMNNKKMLDQILRNYKSSRKLIFKS